MQNFTGGVECYAVGTGMSNSVFPTHYTVYKDMLVSVCVITSEGCDGSTSIFHSYLYRILKTDLAAQLGCIGTCPCVL